MHISLLLEFDRLRYPFNISDLSKYSVYERTCPEMTKQSPAYGSPMRRLPRDFGMVMRGIKVPTVEFDAFEPELIPSLDDNDP